MGLSSRKPPDAWPGDGPHRRADRPKARPQARRIRHASGLFGLILWLAANAAAADTVRIAAWHTELQRDGPGLLLRDILKGEAEDIAAVARIVALVDADILLLMGIDWDHGLAAAHALAETFAAAGARYPHIFALRPNTGLATGLDMDGDGRTGGPRDAQGYGAFAGQGGMLLLSKFPIDVGGVRDFTPMLWRDLPEATLPVYPDARPFPSEAAQSVQRLSHTAHWHVPVILPDGTSLTLLAYAAGPPVFDGPEDRNGLRTADESRLWQIYLNGDLGPPPTSPLVVLGLANLDPRDGDGDHSVIAALLDHPRLQDPAPAGPGGAEAAVSQGGTNLAQTGDPVHDTADWADEPGGPGNLRVVYVLPDAALTVTDSGVVWPVTADPLAPDVQAASRHRLVWVDVAEPR